jgi:hypothetical protein
MTITWHGDGGFTRTSMNRAGLYPRGGPRSGGRQRRQRGRIALSAQAESGPRAGGGPMLCSRLYKLMYPGAPWPRMSGSGELDS